jgi:hypothetical protein
VPRVAATAILCSLLAACGAERAPTRAAGEPPPDAPPPSAEALPPEVAELLRKGPGGLLPDDLQLDLQGDAPLPLRIVLEPPAR